jgi:hypothetical protein
LPWKNTWYRSLSSFLWQSAARVRTAAWLSLSQVEAIRCTVWHRLQKFEKTSQGTRPSS